MKRVTADTITDEQIIELRVSDDESLTTQDRIMCSVALEDFRVMPRAICNNRSRQRAVIAKYAAQYGRVFEVHQ